MFPVPWLDEMAEGLRAMCLDDEATTIPAPPSMEALAAAWAACAGICDSPPEPTIGPGLQAALDAGFKLV